MCKVNKTKFLLGLSWTVSVTVIISAEVDRCHPDPCVNEATCVSEDNDYICICPPKFQGRHCDKGNTSSYKKRGHILYSKTLNRTTVHPTETAPQDFHNCLYKNGGCQHFCTEDADLVPYCHCATDYNLAADNKSCVSQGGFWLPHRNEDLMYMKLHIPSNPMCPDKIYFM